MQPLQAQSTVQASTFATDASMQNLLLRFDNATSASAM
jgi:hypothetical protein